MTTMERLQKLTTVAWVLATLFTLLFVYTGFSTKNWLFGRHNHCSMTYNNPNYALKEPILSKRPPYRSDTSSSLLWLKDIFRNNHEYTLSIYETPSSSSFSKDEVDPSTTPLLYIHGFMGNSNQARSISSDMLLLPNIRDNRDFNYFVNRLGNRTMDRNFTFFTIDFGDTLTALSVDETISRSIFLNECISKIQDMYKEADKGKGNAKMREQTASVEGGEVEEDFDVKTGQKKTNSNSKSHPLVIVAHSMGGIVAKLSFLLSNFPSQKLKCGNTVSDLVMLSSPNTAPPFNYDKNMELLFSEVNKAWRGSFHKDCSNTSKYDYFGNIKSSLSASSSGNKHINVNWNCPACTAAVRVVSITGGLFDEVVDPDLTQLTHMTPAMANRTHRSRITNSSNIPTPSQKTFFGRIVGWVFDLVMSPVRFVFGIVYGVISFFKTLINWGYAVYAFLFGTATSLNSSTSSLANVSECSAQFNSSNTSDALMYCRPDNSTVWSNGSAIDNIVYNSTKSAIISGNISISNRKFDSDNTTRTKYLDMLYQLSNFDIDDLREQTAPYKEPLHLNLRTSSIFYSDKTQARENNMLVVDHNAMVWCQEVLRYVLNGLSLLRTRTKAKNGNKFVFEYYNSTDMSKNGLGTFWDEAFPIKYVDPPLDFNLLRHYNCPEDSFELCNHDSRVVGNILYPHVHIDNFSYPVANFLFRNESDSQWAKMALNEKNYLFQLLYNSDHQVFGLAFISSVLQYTSFMFVSGKAISMILFWYVLISVGIANYFQFEIFFGNRNPKCPFRVSDLNLGHDENKDVSNFFLAPMLFKEMLNLSKFNIFVHSNLKIITNIIVNSTSEIKKNKDGAIILSRIVSIVSGIAVCLLLWTFYNYYYYFIEEFLPIVSTITSAICSYTIALVLRFLMHFVSVFIKIMFTTLSDLVRKFWMKLFNSGTFLGDISLFGTVFGTSSLRNCLFSISYMTLFVFFVCSFTHVGSHISDGVYYQNVALFALYVLLAVLIALCLFSPILVSRSCQYKDVFVNSIGRSLYMTDLGLLYLPLLALLMPTFKLASSTIFPDLKNHYDDVVIFDIFGPNNITIIFLILLVCLHILVVFFASSILTFAIKPANYMRQFFFTETNSSDDMVLIFMNKIVNDSEELSQILDSKKSNDIKKDDQSKKEDVATPIEAATLKVTATCIHEDGGKKAVFENILENDLPENSLHRRGNVILGPTYKVYCCNCASVVPMIKNARDFCEWCRCINCGGRSATRWQKTGPSANDPRYKAYLDDEARRKGEKIDDESNNSNGRDDCLPTNSSPIVNFVFDLLIANSSLIIFLLCRYWATQDSMYRFSYVFTSFACLQLARRVFVRQSNNNGL